MYNLPASGPHTLANYAKELILSVSGTLRTLNIHATVRFGIEDAIAILPEVGPRLHHLYANLVPPPQFGHSSGDPEHTRRLQDCVQLHCTALLSEADVCCHWFVPRQDSAVQ